MNEENIKEIAEEEAQNALSSVAQNEAPEIEPERDTSSEEPEAPVEVAVEAPESQPEAVVPLVEKCQCPVAIRPMAEWVQGEKPNGECRPCLLPPVVQWYRDTLKEHGQEGLASELEEAAEKPDVTILQLCQKLDIIKATVEEPLRERLEEFDCSAQAHKND